MLSKRVVALSPDKAFSKRMAAGLMAAGGMVETHASLDDLARGEIQADLVVLHMADGSETVLKAVDARLKKDGALIVIIPSSSLTTTVKVMREARVSAVLVADSLEPAMLSSVATRLLFGDVFGLEKVMPWGVRVYSTLVGDYQEKSVAISAMSDFAASIGVRRKYRESIEQCLDELLMNALYDAPVDQSGRQLFADIPTKTRISLRMEQKAVVQYACDGEIFAFSVRDSFGMLKSDIVLKYLDKCLHADQQIDRKAGGAGLGLYIISNATTQFMLNLYPGVATEAICTFDLDAPKVQLKNFGFFQEKIDSAGRLVAGPSKLLVTSGKADAPAASASRGITAALAAAIVLLLALIAIVAYPRLVTSRSDISVETNPAGALIEIDGRAVGATSAGPLTVGDLEVGQKYKVTARLEGYEPVDEIVAPIKGATAPLRLALKPKAATVTFETDPPGAAVVVDGKELGVTPFTTTALEAGSTHDANIRLVGYSDVTRKIKVPPPGQRATESLGLVMSPDFGSVTIDSEPPGAQVVQNGELLAGLRTPVRDHLVQADRSYTFTLKAPGYMPENVKVTVSRGQRSLPVKATLKTGGSITVEAEHLEDARISVAKVPACQDRPSPMLDCPVADGKYLVRVMSGRPFANEAFAVTVQGDEVKRTVSFGLVEAASADLTLHVAGAPRNARKLALTEGTHAVTVTDGRGGGSVTKNVRVVGGRTVVVDATP